MKTKALGKVVPSFQTSARKLNITVGAQQWLDRYDRYLDEVAGLTAGTRIGYGHYAGLFLQWLFGRQPLRWERLCAATVMEFVQATAPRLRPTTAARMLTVALRRWIRFLAFRGVCSPSLEGAVPRVAAWPRQELPAVLSVAQSRKLRAVFKCSTAEGRRDYAITLCLLEAGLRAGEVAALNLDQLDWRSGVVRLPECKQRRERVLPLPLNVGRALAAYLKTGRPESTWPQVFLSRSGTNGVSPQQINALMRSAFARSGLPYHGTHVLRRTFATRLHQAGASLKEVADWLGHRSLAATVCYARVNLRELRQIILPWPEGWR